MAEIKITATGDEVAIAALNNVAKAMADASAKAKETTDAHKELGSSGIWLVDVMRDLGSSFVGHVAEGVLLRDAVHALIDGFKSAAEALPALIEHTVELEGHLYDMSLKTGASVENLSKLRYVAAETGIDFDSFGNILFKMEAALGASGSKADAMQQQLDRVGLRLNDLRQMKPDEAFIAITAAIEKIPDRMDQAAVGAALFGKGFKDMAGLTQENIGALMQKADDLGLTINTMNAAAADAADDGFQQLKLQVEAAGLKIGNAFLPAVIGLEGDLSDGLSVAVKALGSELSGTTGYMGTLARAMGTGDDATKAQMEMYEGLKDVLLSLTKYTLEPLITTIGFVMSEFNAGKVIFGDVMQVLNTLALGFEEVGLYATKALNAVSFGKFKDDVKMFEGGINELKNRIYEQADALAANKKAETDWAQWSVDANHSVQVALDAVGAAHTDVKAKIEEGAAASRHAVGEAAEDVELGTKKVKEYTKAWDELNSMGRTYMETVAELDPAVESEVEQWLRAGAAVATITKAYPSLSEAQVKAVDEMIKASDKYEKAWETNQAAINKVWDDAVLIEEQNSKRGLGLQLDKLAQQEANEKAAAAKTITNEIQLVDMLAAIDQKYQIERRNLITKSEEDIAAKTAALWTETDNLIQKGAMSTADFQIAQVQRWYENEKAKAGLAGIDDKGYYDGLAALAQAKMQEVTRSHDEMYQAVHKLQEDLQTNWLTTFEDTLVTTHSFKDAFVGVFNLIKTDVETVFADMLGSIIKGFLQPLMDQVSSVTSSITRSIIGALTGSGGGGGGYGGMVSSLGGLAASSMGIGGAAAGESGAAGAAAAGIGISGGAIAATAGIAAAGIGVYYGVKALMGQHESMQVNDDRDAWYQARGGVKGVNEGIQGYFISQGMSGDEAWAKEEPLLRALQQADRRDEFDRATQAIHDAGVPGFAGGTGGEFIDFGSRTRVDLHGKERVMTEREGKGVEDRLDAIARAHDALASKIENMLRVQPMRMRHAMRGI